MGKNVVELHDAIKELDSSSSLQKLSKMIGSRSQLLSGAQASTISLYRIEEKESSFLFASVPDALTKKLSTSGSYKHALKTKTTVTLTASELNTLQSSTQKNQFQSGMLFPIVSGSGTVILFGIFSFKTDAFPDDTLSSFTAYIIAAGLALKNVLISNEMHAEIEYRNKIIAKASHDIRNPLTSLGGYIQMLHRKMSMQETIEAGWVREIYTESGRVTSLVIELLDVRQLTKRKRT